MSHKEHTSPDYTPCFFQRRHDSKDWSVPKHRRWRVFPIGVKTVKNALIPMESESKPKTPSTALQASCSSLNSRDRDAPSACQPIVQSGLRSVLVRSCKRL